MVGASWTGVVDVLEVPIACRVPGVAELPVVAGRGISTPASRRGAQLPLMLVPGVVAEVVGDSIDGGMDGLRRGRARDGHANGARWRRSRGGGH